MTSKVIVKRLLCIVNIEYDNLLLKYNFTLSELEVLVFGKIKTILIVLLKSARGLFVLFMKLRQWTVRFVYLIFLCVVFIYLLIR